MPRSENQARTLFRSRARMQCPAVSIVGVPNAAKRGQWAINQAKREGISAGFPDDILLWPGGGIAFIEWKAEKGGVVSANQSEWIDRLNRLGFPAAVQNDPDRALAWLREQGAPFLAAAA